MRVRSVTPLCGVVILTTVPIIGCDAGALMNRSVRAVVKHHLIDPESATFRHERVSARDPEVWCGEVNARNRMGGMVGYTRFVATVRPGEPAASPLHDVRLEPARDSRAGDLSDPTSQGSVFASRWRMFCAP